jgi:putative transcriptional regulator
LVIDHYNTTKNKSQYQGSNKKGEKRMIDRAILRQKMGEANLSQAALGEKVGVSQQMIAHILMGRKRPTLELAVAMARALGCTVDEIIESEEA